METLKMIVGGLSVIGGVFGMIGGAIAAKVWAYVIILLSLLKLFNIANLGAIPWFAGVTTLGAVSTGLWLLLFGLLVIFIGIIITGIGAVIIDKL